MNHLRRPLLFLAVTLAACSSLSRGDVQREWNNTFRELGILPVYPPREDVQVGDVYVRRGSAGDLDGVDEKGFVPIDLYLASADVNQAIGQRYLARPEFPTTPAGADDPIARVPSKDRSSTRAKEASSGAEAPAGMFGEGNVQRLRQVAFPEFSTITLTSGDLSAVLPIKALSLAFAASRSSITAVRLKIPNGESYSLPGADLLLRLAPEGQLDPKKYPAYLLQSLHDGVKQWARTTPGLTGAQRERILQDKYLYLDLINEVYYTRAFEISVDRAVDGAVGGDIKTIDRAAEIATGRQSGAEVDTTKDPKRQDPIQRANALNTRLRETVGNNQGAPRGSLMFTSVSESHIGLVQTYERPIAVGIRAMTIAVDPKTGEIMRAGAGEANPTSGAQSAKDFFCEAMKEELRGISEVRIIDQDIMVQLAGGTTIESVRAKFSKTETKRGIREKVIEKAKQSILDFRFLDSLINKDSSCVKVDDQ